jgi:hypothetical protein
METSGSTGSTYVKNSRERRKGRMNGAPSSMMSGESSVMPTTWRTLLLLPSPITTSRSLSTRRFRASRSSPLPRVWKVLM